MLGLFRKLHWWVVGGEAWAAAYSWLSEHLPKLWDWFKEHWASVVAMTSSLGLGTYFASGINAINSLGWGAWPFAGALFALLLALAFWVFLHGFLALAGRRTIAGTASSNGSASAPAPSAASAADLALVMHRTFVNQEVLIDGNRFLHCRFHNVTLVYNGGEHEIGYCEFRAIRFRTENPIILDCVSMLYHLNMLNIPMVDDHGNVMEKSVRVIEDPEG